MKKYVIVHNLISQGKDPKHIGFWRSGDDTGKTGSKEEMKKDLNERISEALDLMEKDHGAPSLRLELEYGNGGQVPQE